MYSLVLRSVFLVLIFMGISTVSYAREFVSFPSRASDLSANSYWTVSEFSEGCCTLDLNIRRWNGSSWSGASGSADNEQNFDWNKPLYAPANGVIASCWRNFPDDPQPGVNPPNNNRIFGGGNHVVIITDQNNAISINHLKEGTIPAAICPSNSGNTQLPSTTLKQGDWRVASYIESNDRPRVNEGDYIGRVGNSGRSGGPHLHISMAEVVGTDGLGREQLGDASLPFNFRHAWGHRYEHNQQHSSEGWFRLRGNDFTGNESCTSYREDSPECRFKTIHASPYLRRAQASAGEVRMVDTIFLSPRRVVTALINSERNLQLIAWDMDGVNSINRIGDIKAGPVKDVKVTRIFQSHVLTAVRTQAENLKLIAYRVNQNGSFERVADVIAGKIGSLEMAQPPGSASRAITAVTDSNGNLKLISWALQFSGVDASIVRLNEASAGKVKAISIARAKNFAGVYTAVKDADDNLLVIPWKLSFNQNSLTRGQAVTAGNVGSNIAVAPLAQGVSVAVSDSDNNFRFITWSVGADGNIGERRDSLVAGEVSEIKLVTTPLADSNITAIVRRGSSKLSLIGLAADDNGNNVRRVGSSLAGIASKISAAGTVRSYPNLDPRDMILTALRDARGKLKLISWDTNLVNP